MVKHERIQTSNKIVTALKILNSIYSDPSEIMSKPHVAEYLHNLHGIESELAIMAVRRPELETLSILFDPDEDIRIYQKKEYSADPILSTYGDILKVLDKPLVRKNDIDIVFYTNYSKLVTASNINGGTWAGNQTLQLIDPLTPIMLAEYTASDKEYRLDLTGFAYVTNFYAAISKDKKDILLTPVKSRER